MIYVSTYYLIYGGRPLYQYNEDGILFKFYMLSSLLRITSLQVNKEIFF